MNTIPKAKHHYQFLTLPLPDPEQPLSVHPFLPSPPAIKLAHSPSLCTRPSVEAPHQPPCLLSWLRLNYAAHYHQTDLVVILLLETSNSLFLLCLNSLIW